MRPVLLTALLLTLTTSALASSTHRCGSALVSLDATTTEVRAKCGEPANAALAGSKMITDQYGFRHEVLIEEWTYGPQNGMYYFLRFEGNRLRQIDSKRSR